MSHEIGVTASPYNTYLIDNANPAAIALDDATPWVGYYDLGLWKYDGSGWVNCNQDDNDSAWGDGLGGNINGIVTGSTMVVTASKSSKNNIWNVWYSTTGGGAGSWAKSTGSLPTNTFMRGLTYDGTYYWASTGDATDYRALWRASSPSGTWTKKLGRAGLLTVGSNGNTILVGGLYHLYRSTDGGSTWSTVSSIVPPNPGTNEAASDTTSTLHRMRWNGVQQILWDTMGSKWFVVCYSGGSLSSGSRGVYVSSDDGQSFSLLGGSGSPADSAFRRGIAVDSCGGRFHITSGAMFSSVVNGYGNMKLQHSGKQTCRYTGGGSGIACVPDIASNFPVGFRSDQWGFASAHGVVAYDDWLYESNSATVYVLAPGYGVQRYQTGGGNCVERPAGDFSASRPAEEVSVPRRSVFKLSEASGRTYFDLTGRRVKVERPGIYYDPIIKDGRVVSRRTVLVTP